MFWIHGGSFNIGAGTDINTDGQQLANTTNTVVVAINYRLSEHKHHRYSGLLERSSNERAKSSLNFRFTAELNYDDVIKHSLYFFWLLAQLPRQSIFFVGYNKSFIFINKICVRVYLQVTMAVHTNGSNTTKLNNCQSVVSKMSTTTQIPFWN